MNDAELIKAELIKAESALRGQEGYTIEGLVKDQLRFLRLLKTDKVPANVRDWAGKA